MFCFLTWCFGMTAIAFDITDPKNAKPALTHIKRISAVVSYGRLRLGKLLRPVSYECGHTGTPERVQT